MTLSQQEIIDYASRYVGSDEMVDFPWEGDLFCLIGRDLPDNAVLKEEEGWNFKGYGICLGYTLDLEAKPTGKWLWMHFASLASFPPAEQVYKLQPPHVVRGRFQNPSRSSEFRIIKVNMNKSAGLSGNAPVSGPAGSIEEPSERLTSEDKSHGKIVKFRKKRGPSSGGSGPMVG
jgi:hypothetical protein